MTTTLTVQIPKELKHAVRQAAKEMELPVSKLVEAAIGLALTEPIALETYILDAEL
jgi:predicted transcriptional regulator